MGATHIHDLALIIDDLERSGRLTRITGSVDLKHDLAGLAATLEGEPRAVLFENVAGSDWPVLTGLYWSRELLADLLRREESTLPQFVADCIRDWQTSPVDPVVVPAGPVLEVTEADVDLGRMPIPIHAMKDGGPYFDAGVVIARDPETGVRNASIQRFQVVSKDRLHVNIDAGRHLGLYLEKAKARGENLTFTLNCGVGPGLHFAASAPAEAAPADTDELGIASAFHGAPLELVKASNGTDDMVAHAMWALECEMVPGEVADEGPFAEVTGYYAEVAPRPVVHVRKIHRRANPVFQTILSGVEVWNSVGLLGEANVLQLMQKQVPGVTDVYMSHGGGGFYHCIVQIAQQRQGWSKQAILAAFAAFPPLKMVTIVDNDVNLRSAQDVEWAMATRMNPKTDIITIDDSFGHGLNPSFPDYLGSKVGFDATKPYPATWAYERATYKPMTLEAVEMVQPDIVRRLQRGAVTMATQQGAMPSRDEIEAFEAALARPQPIDLTPVGLAPLDATPPNATPIDPVVPLAAAADASDADLTRPQPIDLAALGGGAPAAEPVSNDANDIDDTSDDWITRPIPADLTPVQGNAAAQDGTDQPAVSSDPDAWIAQPALADLTPINPDRARVAPSSGTQGADDPDAWIARPAAADLTPVSAKSPVGAQMDGSNAVETSPVEALDQDSWVTRPMTADLTPVRPAVAEEADTAEPAAAMNAPVQEPDADAWIARPAAIDLTPVAVSRTPSREPAPADTGDETAGVAELEGQVEPTVPAVAPAVAVKISADDDLARPAAANFDPPQPAESTPSADQEATVSNRPSDTVDDIREVAGDAAETADAEHEELTLAETAQPPAMSETPAVEEPPVTVTPADADDTGAEPDDSRTPSRPTASVEKPASVSPLRRFAKASASKKLPSSPARGGPAKGGGSFFEPAEDSGGEATSGEAGRGTEASTGKPKRMVAMTRTNRGELPRKIQPVGLPVSDKNEVVRPAGFFDSTPVPTKPVRKIARSIAKAASSPRLRNVIKPPKAGGFFDDD